VRNAFRYYHEGRRATVMQFLDQLPGELFEQNPQRMIDLAELFTVGGRYAEAVGWLEGADRALATAASPDPVQRARLAGTWALCAHFEGDAALFIKCCEAAMECYRPGAYDVYWSTAPYGVMRAWGWLGDTDAAWAALRRRYPVPPLTEPHSQFIPPATLSQICFIEGRLREADRLAEQALIAGDLSMPDSPALAEARLTRAGVLWERNHLAAAEREYEIALRSAESNHRVAFAVIASLGLARIWQVVGRRDHAFDMLALARQANPGRPLPEPWASRVDAAQAHLLINAGAVAEARRLVGRLPSSTDTWLLGARLSLADGDHSTAGGLLADVDVERLTPRRQLEWRLLDARLGSPTCWDSLARAVQFAAHERFVRCFVDAGDETGKMLSQWGERPEAPFVRELLSGFGEPPVQATDGSGQLADPLTERERAVLALLPGWLSNREIAAELYVSVNTLKTHLKGLYRKLDATSRHNAIVRAKGLGLI
jgi:LuxR family maltose regulon positive regulatory protein